MNIQLGIWAQSQASSLILGGTDLSSVSFPICKMVGMLIVLPPWLVEGWKPGKRPSKGLVPQLPIKEQQPQYNSHVM